MDPGLGVDEVLPEKSSADSFPDRRAGPDPHLQFRAQCAHFTAPTLAAWLPIA